ncbi:MAG: hypothetical protein ACK4FB_11665 [Brevundimonas sp.]|uniref:hypothetical protein n=1 Tax=Brevundimonas sp. TaxID=1871086 RepID=UPI00391985D6
MRVLPLVLAAPLMLGGCVIYASDSGETTTVRTSSASSVQVQARELESVHAVRFERDSAVVRVTSNGCTDKSDFRVEITDGGDMAGEMTLVRAEPDHCRALVAEGVEVSWTYAELGLERGAALVLANPLVVP